MKNYKYVYGPVPSWRLGSSLGVDPISGEGKICTFDCVYCQLGKTKIFTKERRIFVPTEKITREMTSLPSLKIDYITFSGTGEPTLAKNLGEMIKAVKKIRKEKVAVLTNSSLMKRKDVQEDLLLADLVVAKLDASSQNGLNIMNKPIKTVRFENIIDGIKDFSKYYAGKLALQIMFISRNKKYAAEIARTAKEISPDEVQINTPLRSCNINPLAKGEILGIKYYFISACKGIKVISVYDENAPKGVSSISDRDTLKRRGKVSDYMNGFVR